MLFSERKNQNISLNFQNGIPSKTIAKTEVITRYVREEKT